MRDECAENIGTHLHVRFDAKFFDEYFGGGLARTPGRDGGGTPHEGMGGGKVVCDEARGQGFGGDEGEPLERGRDLVGGRFSGLEHIDVAGGAGFAFGQGILVPWVNDGSVDAPCADILVGAVDPDVEVIVVGGLILDSLFKLFEEFRGSLSGEELPVDGGTNVLGEEDELDAMFGVGE